MRTNVTLEDDIYEQVMAYASAKDLTLGKAIGELVRKSNAAPAPPSRLVPGPLGIRMMPLNSEAKEITQGMVDKARDEGYFG
jgi:hypothetical protein